SPPSDWRPRSVEDVERLLWPPHPKPHAVIAEGLGIEVAEFSAWAVKMRGIIKARPDALACMHLSDLRVEPRAGTVCAYPPIQPSDVLRRADALSRAAALGKLGKVTPIWPGALATVPFNPHLDAAAGADSRGGWYDGERIPKRPRLNGTKRRDI